MKVQVKTVQDDHGYQREGQFEGFTVVDELEWDNESYQFNITGLWKRDFDGTLWMAHDSGCSCPIPWEKTTELERVFSMDQLKELVREHHRDQEDGWTPGPRPGSVDRFLENARAVLGAL